MATQDKDPTEAMRLKASQYSGVDEGTACTQSSFKTNKRGFLYCGMQGGRFKAMFKLQKSLAEAATLAEQQPENYHVGVGGWVTARFTAQQPMPKRLWEKWLDESYELSVASGAVRKSPAKRKKGAEKKIARKKTTKGAAAKPKRKVRPK